MSLSTPVSRRALRHTRAIDIQAFAREDGLWDLDAHITDIKTIDTMLASGPRKGGEPVHDLWLRITIDKQLTIVDAEASSDAVPYPGHCNTIGPAYKSLVGLSLMKGFRNEVKQRLSGVLGCTHLTELAQILPTAAIQAFANDVWPVHERSTHHEKPFQLDKCHALKTDGGAVAEFYPRWSTQKEDVA